ncbi:NAD(P)H-binding protein [Pseudorhodoferax sp. Leaf267]|uniref:NAD(P)H-binding protein n=1 Tax=Pseudorhodoferax sp. Leaf267 TaxID=1736316 RepID=UPI0006FCEDFC|nr:NAD(P)H-binding protein [Pseudorhodoferax sp. Leaf267]KQP21520.1 nucleoside-diphosphate sugar epimerase [Pseudorhodoferax sp. Leaf267]
MNDAVLLAGATGLVGREILGLLLADRSIARVHTLGRRPAPLQHAKLQHHASDLRQMPALPPVQAVYIALGTTIKVAGSQEAFRAVDHDAVLAVARAARAAGARRLGLVSAMGADAGSRVFYSRVKGEVEQAVAALGYDSVVIARPSLLIGDRGPLGQPARRGETIGEAVSKALRPLIPANYRAILASDVAKALVAGVARGAPGVQTLLSGQMQRN